MTASIAVAKMQEFKHSMSGISVGMEVRKIEPLRSWPAKPHIRQGELDAYRSMPSEYNGVVK